jgi:hypothetical protein
MLQRWETDPAEAHSLRTTVASVREQLHTWESDGVYPSTNLQLLWDHLAHIDARLTLAEQEAARGY